jgi:hypothetical protein
MASYFSEHYAAKSSATVAIPQAIPISQRIAEPGLSRAYLMRDRVALDFRGIPEQTEGANTLVAGDTFRLMTLRSSDRIDTIYGFIPSSGAGDWNSSGANSWNLGLYESGANHDGNVIDAALFCSNLSFTTAVGAYQDWLVEAGTIDGYLDRGKPLWELAALGAANYTEDPLIEMDLVLTLIAITGTMLAHGSWLAQVEYTRAGK